MKFYSFIVFILIVFISVSFSQEEEENLCERNFERWLLWGQYVQFNQTQTDWSKVRESLCTTPYNGFTVHLLSPWGNTEGFYPWVRLPDGTYDLNSKNQLWFDKLREFATEIGGKGKFIISIAFFDRYFESKWNASSEHPFRENNLRFNWGDSADPLYVSSVDRKPGSWRKRGWVAWKQDDSGSRRRNQGAIIRYNRVGRSFNRYMADVISVFNEVKKEYPNLIIVYRLLNEESARLAADSSLQSGTTLEDSIEITKALEGMWRAAENFTPGKDLFATLDWGMYQGTDLQLDWMKRANHAVKSLGWLQEIHGCDQKRVRRILAQKQVDAEVIIFSTDGLKLEEHPYFTRESRALFEMKLPKLDLKVPNEMAEYHKGDFNKTFDATLPVMLKFTPAERLDVSQ